MYKKNKLSFLFFCGPAIIIFTIVMLYALATGLFITFTNWDGLAASFDFVGMENYKNALSDPFFWESLRLTSIYALSVVFFTNIIAFSLAFIMTRGIKGQNFFRAGFFTPNLIGGITLGLIWKFVFSKVIVNIGTFSDLAFLSSNWLSKTQTAMIALIIVAVWQLSGYLIIIYMAGIVGINKSILEAISLESKINLTVIKKIILPLIMPSITICLFLSIKASFVVYDVNLSLTGGNPFNSTELISMFVYNKVFISEEYGVGQAQAIILFAIVALITIIQVSITKRKEINA